MTWVHYKMLMAVLPGWEPGYNRSYFPKTNARISPILLAVLQCDLAVLHQEMGYISPHPWIWAGCLTVWPQSTAQATLCQFWEEILTGGFCFVYFGNQHHSEVWLPWDLSAVSSSSHMEGEMLQTEREKERESERAQMHSQGALKCQSH